MSEKRFSWDGDILFDNLELRELGNCLEARDIADLLNEQQEKITELELELTYYKNRKEQCNHKKVILDFLNFMNMDNPVMEIMVSEFLEEVYEW